MKTKSVLFVLGLLLLGIGTTNAQVRDQTSIGPRVGVNFSNVSNTNNSKSITGLVLGLTSTYSFDESTGLTIDLLYSQEGYKQSNDEFKVSYFQIPIYFDLFFGALGEKFRPKVYAGVVPGFLLNAKVNGVTYPKDAYNTLNLAVSGGLGFNLRASNRIWINADLRAYLGLTDVRDKDIRTGDKITNSTIQPSIGLAYGLAKL